MSTVQVLLIKRAKPPNVGWWSFPGGGLELGAVAAGRVAMQAPLRAVIGLYVAIGSALTVGEKIVDCAVREVQEETGIVLADCGAKPDGAHAAAASTLTSDLYRAVCVQHWVLTSTALSVQLRVCRLVRAAAVLTGQPRALRRC
jgi:8-oxo-dGTP pyrophosphatase MutT (NUDIX family)